MRERETSAEVLLIDEILNYEQLCARLKLPKRTVERMVSKDEIPYKRIGRTIRFYWPDVMAWFRGQGAKR